MSEYSFPLLFLFFTFSPSDSFWTRYTFNRFIFPFHFSLSLSSFESWNFSRHRLQSSSRHLLPFYYFSLSDIQTRNWEHSLNTVSLLRWVSSMSKCSSFNHWLEKNFIENPRASLSLFQFFSLFLSFPLFFWVKIYNENVQRTYLIPSGYDTVETLDDIKLVRVKRRRKHEQRKEGERERKKERIKSRE